MKAWIGFGTEHSMNLVMIGSFRDATDAAEAVRVIEALTDAVNAEVEQHGIEPGEYQEVYPDSVMQVTREADLYSLATFELEQFAYHATVTSDGPTVRITTDEVDVSAFLKVLLARGAKVQIYSAHDYPDRPSAEEENSS